MRQEPREPWGQQAQEDPMVMAVLLEPQALRGQLEFKGCKGTKALLALLALQVLQVQQEHRVFKVQ